MRGVRRERGSQRERVRSRAYDHQKKFWASKKLPHDVCLEKARDFSRKILTIWDRDEGACFSVGRVPELAD